MFENSCPRGEVLVRFFDPRMLCHVFESQVEYEIVCFISHFLCALGWGIALSKIPRGFALGGWSGLELIIGYQDIIRSKIHYHSFSGPNVCLAWLQMELCRAANIFAAR